MTDNDFTASFMSLPEDTLPATNHSNISAELDSDNLMPCSCGHCSGKLVNPATDWRHRLEVCARSHKKRGKVLEDQGLKRKYGELGELGEETRKVRRGERELQRHELEDTTVLDCEAPLLQDPDCRIGLGEMSCIPSPPTSVPSMQSCWDASHLDTEASSDSDTESSQCSEEDESHFDCINELETEIDGEPDAWLEGSLGEALEREAASSEARKLSELDLEILRALSLKLHDNLSDSAFNRLPQVFRSLSLPPLSACESRLRVLAGVETEFHDMCINSCICYAPDAFRNLNACPHCHESRYDSTGVPRKRYQYLPFTPRLLARQANPTQATNMLYRDEQTRHRSSGMADYTDATHYRNLLGTHVKVNGKQLPHTYFSDRRDIALGLSTDGFAPFRKRKMT
ncbi:hypothetical protein BD311DRAFT_689313, partial [Dichomitus squalens]